MKRTFKRFLAIGCGVLVVGFFLFLYFIPPFTLVPPASLVKPEIEAGPHLTAIADERERVIAEHGEYLVKSMGCSSCHVPASSGGAPNWNRYLAGGAKITVRGMGAAYAYNLTPDSATGLGKYTKEEIVQILKTGQLPDGRIMSDRQMPWTMTSRLSEGDLYAIATYLGDLRPVNGRIPPGEPDATVADSAVFQAYSIRDHSQH